MSYARFGEEGSDVYVFLTDVRGEEKYQCCACFLLQDSSSVYTDSAQDMIDHLEYHVEQGHTVPARAFEELQEDLDNV